VPVVAYAGIKASIGMGVSAGQSCDGRMLSPDGGVSFIWRYSQHARRLTDRHQRRLAANVAAPFMTGMYYKRSGSGAVGRSTCACLAGGMVVASSSASLASPVDIRLSKGQISSLERATVYVFKITSSIEMCVVFL